MYPPDGPEEAQFRAAAAASPYVATHVALSVQRTVEEIQEVAGALGWRAIRLSRGPFDVVEFWIENHVMVELMTPEMTRDYLASVPRRP